MWEKKFTERIIVATSQYHTTEFTRKFYDSVKQDGIPFTFLVGFDGTPKEKIDSISDIVDIGVTFKNPVHSIPEIWNCILNVAKSSDAEFIMLCCNDIEFKKGSFEALVDISKTYKNGLPIFDVISPVKIDKDIEKFKAYSSQEDIVEVIGANDSVWFIRLHKLNWNHEERDYGPFGFEDVPFMYELWKNNARFVVEPKAVILHHCSQDTAYCFTPEDRAMYSKEWDIKRDYFLKDNDSNKKWFFDNVIMNAEGIKKFGYPVYIK